MIPPVRYMVSAVISALVAVGASSCSAHGGGPPGQSNATDASASGGQSGSVTKITVEGQTRTLTNKVTCEMQTVGGDTGFKIFDGDSFSDGAVGELSPDQSTAKAASVHFADGVDVTASTADSRTNVAFTKVGRTYTFSGQGLNAAAGISSGHPVVVPFEFEITCP